MYIPIADKKRPEAILRFMTTLPDTFSVKFLSLVKI